MLWPIFHPQTGHFLDFWFLRVLFVSGTKGSKFSHRSNVIVFLDPSTIASCRVSPHGCNSRENFHRATSPHLILDRLLCFTNLPPKKKNIVGMISTQIDNDFWWGCWTLKAHGFPANFPRRKKSSGHIQTLGSDGKGVRAFHPVSQTCSRIQVNFVQKLAPKISGIWFGMVPPSYKLMYNPL